MDHVLQVARCFLPHRFKRSFTITFLNLEPVCG
ncbi:Xanthine dehydrogenase/oxidase [Bienertia sinuspersici]